MTDQDLNLPDYLPERVKRVYRQTETKWTCRAQIQIYSLEMTEAIDVSVLEETFGVICFNGNESVTRINLEWWEYDGCYGISLNDGEERFAEPVVKEHDVPTSEEMYAKWLEIINGIMQGVL